MAERRDAADASEWLGWVGDFVVTAVGMHIPVLVWNTAPVSEVMIIQSFTCCIGGTVAQLIIPAESAHSTITALGEVGLLEFRDLNEEKSAFQRSYASQVSMVCACVVHADASLRHGSNTQCHLMYTEVQCNHCVSSHPHAPQQHPPTIYVAHYSCRSSGARRWRDV